MAPSMIIINQNEIRDSRGRIVLGTIGKLNDERFCFVCTQCDGEFLSFQSYEKHISLVHKKPSMAEDVKPTLSTVNVRYGKFSMPATQQPTQTITLSDSEDDDRNDDDIFLISSGDDSEINDDRTAAAVFHMKKSLKREPIFEINENVPAKVQFTVQKVVKREPTEVPEFVIDETAKKTKLDHQRASSSSTSNGHKPAAVVKMEIDDHSYSSSTMPSTNGNNHLNGSSNKPIRSIDVDFDFEWSGSDVDLSEATSFGIPDVSDNSVEENSETNCEEEDELDMTIQADDIGSKCSWCPQTFDKIFDLNRHLLTCEGWLKQFVACEQCPNKKFKWNAAKGIHMHKIHSNPNRPFNCKSCTRSFATHLQLCQHRELMHTKTAVIECHFCKDTKFLSWFDRNQHVLKKHQFGEYECYKNGCGYTCKTPDDLEQHKKKIHNHQMPA